jgi:hypothetical protein
MPTFKILQSIFFFVLRLITLTYFSFSFFLFSSLVYTYYYSTVGTKNGEDKNVVPLSSIFWRKIKRIQNKKYGQFIVLSNALMSLSQSINLYYV